MILARPDCTASTKKRRRAISLLYAGPGSYICYAALRTLNLDSELLDEAPSEQSVRRIRRPDRWYLAGALLILLAVSFLSYRDWSAFQSTASQVQHSRELLQEVEDTMSSIRDAESGQRGFVLTGDSQYLDAYNSAVAALPSELSKLLALVSGEPALRTRVTTLSSLIAEKLSELK